MKNVTVHWLDSVNHATEGQVEARRETEAEAIEIVDGFVKVSHADPVLVDTLIPTERVVKIDNNGDGQ